MTQPRVQAERTLEVRTSTGGNVVSADRRIDCGSDCSATYHRALATTLRAEPEPGFLFAHWTGACVGKRRRCVVALDGRSTVLATFARVPRIVRLTVGGPGTVVSEPVGLVCGSSATTCAASFGEGTTIRLSALPDAAGVFHSWSGSACSGQPAPSCEVVIPPGDLTTAAIFRSAAPDPGDVALTVRRGLGGRVVSTPGGIACPPVCAASFASGTVVTLATGVRETAWREGCVGEEAACALVLDRPTEASVLIPPVPSPAREVGLSVTVTGPGVVSGGHSYASDDIRCGGATGTLLDCQGLFPPRTTVKLKAVADDDARFKRWQYFCRGKRPRCRVRLTAPKTVRAVFRRSK